LLNIFPFNHTKEVYSFEFLEKEYSQYKVICPNPVSADAFRKKSKKNNVEVITIAKYLNDEIGDVKVKRKGELLLFLSFVWKQFFSESKYESFVQAFNLLTELRSFTLDFTQVLELLEDRDEDIAKAVKVFWYYILENEIIDEHQAISLIREKVSQYDTLDDCYVFWGFNHLSAGQIDFIKELAEKSDVYIPLPYMVLSYGRNTDWPYWLSTDINQNENENDPITINTLRYSKSRMNEKLRPLLLAEKNVEVFLAKKNPTISEINEIPLDNAFFRSRVDLFSGPLIEEIKRIEDKIIPSGKKLAADELEQEIQQQYKKAISEFSIKDGRKLRVFQLLLSHLEIWKEAGGDEFSAFDLKIMKNIVSLALPRNYHMPLHEKAQHSISGLENLFDYSEDSTKVICVSSDYERIRPGIVPYDPQMVSTLASLGPLKNPDFEFQMTRFFLMEILSSSNSLLVIENDIEENDLGWEEILKDCEQVENGVETVAKKEIKYLANPKTDVEKRWRFSPTKIQEFLDCPKKYFHKYHYSLPGPPSSDNLLMPFHLGNLEHQVVRDHFEGKISHFDNHISDLIKEFTHERHIVLSDFYFKKYFIEIRDISRNFIEALERFNDYENIQLDFEKPINDNKDNIYFEGRADLIVTTPQGKGVIDFKRSEHSVPSIEKLITFKKVQLSYYACHYGEDIKFVGYISGADIKKSLFLFDEDEALIEMIKSIGFFKKNNQIQMKTFLDDYQRFEDETVRAIMTQDDFRANPQDSSVCNFCTLKNVCSKGSDHA